MNKGKNFERQFQESAKSQDLLIIRLNDTSLSWEHEISRFTCENPCDFIIYYKGKLFPLELKSTEYKSISIERSSDQKAMIKMHQWNALSNFGLHEGVYAGLILNFREKEGLEEKTYWVPIQDFVNFMDASNKSSINQNDIMAMPNSMILDQKLKRTNYIYYVNDLLDKIIDLDF